MQLGLPDEGHAIYGLVKLSAFTNKIFKVFYRISINTYRNQFYFYFTNPPTHRLYPCRVTLLQYKHVPSSITVIPSDHTSHLNKNQIN